MSGLSEAFPFSAVYSLSPFVEGLSAVGRKILVLMPYNGYAVGLMLITRVLREERTSTMLVFFLDNRRLSVVGGEVPTERALLGLSELRYLLGPKTLQTADGTECFCVINDSQDTLSDLVKLYVGRYPKALVVTIEE